MWLRRLADNVQSGLRTTPTPEARAGRAEGWKMMTLRMMGKGTIRPLRRMAKQ